MKKNINKNNMKLKILLIKTMNKKRNLVKYIIYLALIEMIAFIYLILMKKDGLKQKRY